MWYLVGFSLVYGESVRGFIGSPLTHPVLIGINHDGCLPGQSIPGLAYVTFQMMFATITPLLMTGAFAERLLWKPYLGFIILWEVFVFYPAAHWIWHKDGWLAQMGALDFAGGIVIHTTAGAGALVSASLVHPRAGFGGTAHFTPSSIPLACVGGAFLWMGWFGFNAGSALSSTAIAALVVANTQIASCTCSCVWLVLSWFRGHPNVEDLLNGAIAGLAGITPAAGYVSTLASLATGAAIGFTSYFSVGLVKVVLGIDDALDVSSVHGVPGIVGALAIGLAADKSYNPSIENEGLFISNSGYLFGVQALAIVVCGAYSGLLTYVIMKLLHAMMPLSTLHMDSAVDNDALGLDLLEFEISAYEAPSTHWKKKKRRNLSVESEYDPAHDHHTTNSERRRLLTTS